MSLGRKQPNPPPTNQVRPEPPPAPPAKRHAGLLMSGPSNELATGGQLPDGPTPEQRKRWVEMCPWLHEIVSQTAELDAGLTVNGISLGRLRALADYLSRGET